MVEVAFCFWWGEGGGVGWGGGGEGEKGEEAVSRQQQKGGRGRKCHGEKSRQWLLNSAQCLLAFR